MKTVDNQIPMFEGIPSPDDLAQLADLLLEAGLETIELSDGKGARCFMRMTAPVTRPDVQITEDAASATEATSRLEIRAPYFGTLVLTDLAKVGTSVAAGAVVAQMQIGVLQIPVIVPVAGTVMDVVGEDGALTGYGALIVQVEPAN
ncbi:biotin/lipoyl-containing protein [Gluconobacter kondonii]|uniref:biotin/lipoyl-containing protein n=1 Tax=Gluconobacter kondonii TaxID=941463 RepID=UPI001B8D7A0B|nr:biotin/lipoyl-containing protein [Gluconobacter kondonii]MBS1054989.1 hypothetical protein [Gluconobacter kondonii]MBS1058261.1 hypothetical protein [Gluconobacter kondonii]